MVAGKEFQQFSKKFSKRRRQEVVRCDNFDARVTFCSCFTRLNINDCKWMKKGAKFRDGMVEHMAR